LDPIAQAATPRPLLARGSLLHLSRTRPVSNPVPSTSTELTPSGAPPIQRRISRAAAPTSVSSSITSVEPPPKRRRILRRVARVLTPPPTPARVACKPRSTPTPGGSDVPTWIPPILSPFILRIGSGSPLPIIDFTSSTLASRKWRALGFKVTTDDLPPI